MDDLREPVGQIEALIKRDGHLIFGFTPEQQLLLQTLFQFETEFTGFLERTHLDRILDEIRNQVLRWAIALDKAGVRGDGLTFSNEEKDKAHRMIFHADNGSLTIGVVGTAGGRANVATGFHPHAGSIGPDDIRQLLAAIGQHIATLQLPLADTGHLETALTELQHENSSKQIDAGNVREALDRILNILGKAGETVITVGTKAYIEAWMKQHGL